MLNRRTLLGGSLGALGAAGLAGTVGCSLGPEPSAGGTGGLAPVTYQLSWTHSIQFGGTYLAQQAGLFTDAGLQVTLAPGGPNVAGDASTVSGQSLVNISGGDGVALSNAEGADLVIIARQYQRAAITVLSLAEAPLETPEDLRGARIGVAGANVPALEAFLGLNQMSTDDLEVIPYQYDPAVLTAGQTDGVVCFYTDLPVALRQQGVEGYSMLMADFGYNPMAQTYTVLRDSLADEETRAQLVALFRADAQGWQRYREDLQAAVDVTLESYPDAGLDPGTQADQAEVQLDLMFSEVTDTRGFGWFDDADVEANLELYGQLGIDGADASMWDHSILDEVYADGPVA